MIMGLVTFFAFISMMGACLAWVLDGTSNMKDKTKVDDNSQWIYQLWFAASAFMFMMTIMIAAPFYMFMAIPFWFLGCYWKSIFLKRNPEFDKRAGTVLE